MDSQPTNKRLLIRWLCLVMVPTGLALIALGQVLSLKHRVDEFIRLPDTVSSASVRQALMSDPKMLLDAFNVLKAQEQAAQTEASKSLVNAAKTELLAPSFGFLGNPTGTHVVSEFFDYQCIHCREAVPSVAQAIHDDPQLKIIFRVIPILGPESAYAARMAAAAAKQGLYMKIHDALMALPIPMNRAMADAAAQAAGADMTKLHADMMSADVTKSIEANLSLARRVGVSGTPSFAMPGRGLMVGWSTKAAFEAFVDGRKH